MKVISIGLDRKIFDENSAVHGRTVSQSKVFEELHIVIFSKKSDGLENKKIAENVWLYPTNSTNRWSYVFDAIKIGKEVAKEVLGKDSSVKNTVITCQDPFETGYVGMKVSKVFNIPLHIQIHTDMFSPFFQRGSVLNRIRVYISRQTLSYAKAIRVVSRRIKESLVEKYGQDIEGKVTVLPVYLDVKNFLNKPVSTDLSKKYSQFDSIILLISRLEKEKNIPLAFNVLSLISVKYPKAGMVVVGSGSEVQSLKRLAKKMGLKDKVIFENWTNNSFSYYKTANLHLVTSWYEGYGLTIVESLLSGTPVVSTDIGIAKDFLENKEYSYVCGVGDAQCLASKVSSIIGNYSLGARLIVDMENVVKNSLLGEEDYLVAYRDSIAKSLG